MGLLFTLILFGLAWFLLIRPQQQRARRHRELLSLLEVGDEVVTAGGIVGRITMLDDDRVSLSVAPGVELTLLRGAIAQRMSADFPGDAIDDPGDGGDRL